MGIRQDLQAYDVGTWVELYELDATALGDSAVHYFCAAKNPLGADVVWQGNVYVAWPVEAGGFEWKAGGQAPQPTLDVGDVGGSIGALCRLYGDLVGARVKRHRTLLKYLDAANFSGGNPSADPTAELPVDVYLVQRKALEVSGVSIQFELAPPTEVYSVLLPRRQVVQNVCTWRYRSAECGYAGGAVADANDVPTAVLANDACGKRLDSCRLRFGANAPLPYGAFPGVGKVR